MNTAYFCCGLNVYVPPKLPCWDPNPRLRLLESGAFGRCLSWRLSPHNETSAFITKEAPERPLVPSAPWNRRPALMGMRPCWRPGLGPQAQTVGHKRLSCIRPPVCGFCYSSSNGPRHFPTYWNFLFLLPPAFCGFQHRDSSGIL